MRKKRINKNLAPTTAWGYVRVSTSIQVRAGSSLDAQQRAIEAHCEMKGLTLARVIVEPGVSAAKTPLGKRPGGGELIAAIERGEVGVVVIYKLDRAFRNTIETLLAAEDWAKRGVAMHLLDFGGMAVDTGNAFGKFFLTTMAGVAEMERNLTAERVSDTLAHKIAQGELVGSTRLGHTAVLSGRERTMRDGTTKPIKILAPNAKEQAAMARAQALAGDHTLREIAAILTDEGFSPRGKYWHPQTISRMIAAKEAC